MARRTRRRFGAAGKLSRFSCRKSEPIIRVIVGRLHVGASDREVGDTVVSRMKKGLPAADYANARKCAAKIHAKNRKLYSQVMSGRIR